MSKKNSETSLPNTPNNRYGLIVRRRARICGYHEYVAFFSHQINLQESFSPRDENSIKTVKSGRKAP